MNKAVNYGLQMKSIETSEEKGEVTILANGLEIKDFQGDVSARGSFKKTLGDFNLGKRSIFHYKNHNSNETVGFIIHGEETDKDLVLTSRLNLKKQIGLETFEDYKLAQELGKNIEHSVGVIAIKRDVTNKSIVTEWYLDEVSTLTKRGANPSTGFIDLKSIDAELNPEKAIEYLKSVLTKRYSDDKLKIVESQLELLEKAIITRDVNLVQCPDCGLTFDYNGVKEHSFEQEVIDTLQNYYRWTADDVVREEMQKLKPEIREQVLNIINQKKSFEQLQNYVHCPKCYKRIYRANTIKVHEPLISTQQKSRPEDTLSWKTLSEALKN